MEKENPLLDFEKTQEFHLDNDLVRVVAELPGGIVLRDLRFEGIDLSLAGTDENGIRFVVPFKEFDSVKLRQKESLRGG